MRRVTLLLELMEDEAEQLFTAVSATDVRFGGFTLNELMDTSSQGLPAGRDGSVGHHACSDGVLYQGGPRHSFPGLK